MNTKKNACIVYGDDLSMDVISSRKIKFRHQTTSFGEKKFELGWRLLIYLSIPNQTRKNKNQPPFQNWNFNAEDI